MGTQRTGPEASLGVVARLALVVAVVAATVAVTPAPATGQNDGAGFTDLYGSTHAGFIEAIAAAGITSGCAVDRYCPHDGVSRGQMSAFLVRAFDLPAAPDAGFSDTAGSFFAADIDAVTAAGIAGGFPDGTFRPQAVVTRGQMATFLAGALDLEAGASSFPDVPGDHVHAPSISAVADAGITTGFPDGTYRPGDQVTRGQMASFLGRALDLEPILIDYPAPVAPDPGPTAVATEWMLASDAVQNYSLSTDRWLVWICQVSEGPDSSPFGRVDLDIDSVLSEIREEMTPFFTWLSEGRYDIRFERGGTFTIPPTEFLVSEVCQEEAIARSAGANGALVVTDLAVGGGSGMIGFACSAPCPNPTTLPDNLRGVTVHGGVMVEVDPISQRRALYVLAHELGHALAFPHSFARETFDEYSDVIDLMSGAGVSEPDGTWMASTIAANRFSAGWLGDRAKLHAGGTVEYTVGSVGYGGTQLVVVPSQEPLAFTGIGAVTRQAYDDRQPAEGITLHRVDQRPEVCAWGPFDDHPCELLARRHAPLGAPYTTDHVLGVGASRDIGGVTVTVLERVGDGFRVRVAGDVADFPVLARPS